MTVNNISQRRGSRFSRRFALAVSVAVIGTPLLAHADSASDKAQQMQSQIDALQQQVNGLKAAPPATTEVAQTSLTDKILNGGPLTWNGITLYGTVDLGLGYQSHGTPLNDYFGPGLEYLVQKNSNRGIFSAAPNGLSQSKIGIKVEEPINDEFTAIGKLETGFNPTSGDLVDGPKSINQNNGVALGSQTSNGDSSRAGQPFQGAAYFGVASEKWGTMTLGLQNAVMADDITAYDPMAGSYAFSVIGYSGAASGFGDTQDARYDSSLKYVNKFGPVRFATQAQFNGAGKTAISAEQFDLGTDWGGLSVDGIYGHVKDAISASALSSVSTTANALGATVSDNTGMGIMAKYANGPITAFGGYEHILFSNAASPLSLGAADIGGYTLTSVNNTAYTTNKTLQVTWTGLKYGFTPAFSLTGAYYHYAQNSYAGNGCQDTSSSACSGTLNAMSMMGDYKVSSRLDVYGGTMYSHVLNGLASGYMHTNAVSPMVGARFNF